MILTFKQFLTEKTLKVYHNGVWTRTEVPDEPPTPKGKKMSADDVFSYVKSIHPRHEDFEDGDLQERIYRYKSYVAKTVNIDDIDSPYYSDIEDEKLPKKYNPIVLTHDLIIIDGTHRYDMAKNTGINTIKAYVGIQ